MGWQTCSTAIRAAAGTDLSDEDIEAIFNKILERKARLKARLGLGDADAVRQATKELGSELTFAAKIEQRNALLNSQAKTARLARIEAAPNLIDGIRAELHGINTPIKGGRFSAEAEWKALSRRYQDGAVSELERAGLFPAFRNGSIERDMARELFELSKGDDGKPGVTGNKQALDMATILNRYQMLAKNDMNKAGAWVGDYSGYITRTSHDADKIRQAGFDTWRKSIEPKLDPRTFEGVEDRAGFLRRTYNGLVTGVHMTVGDAGSKDAAFSGPGNLAKRLSQERVLHFRDADAWLDYNKDFGSYRPGVAILRSFDQAARSTALMRRWGTNPRAAFQQDIQTLLEKYRDRDAGAVDRLGQKTKALQNRFDVLDGTASMPVNRLLARIGSVTRLDQSLSKLGGVLFTHLSVGMTKAAELHYQGIPLLESYGDFLKSMVRGRGKGETREIMDLLGAGMEGIHSDILARFEPDDTVPGVLSKLANTFFKMTGLTYMFDAQKAGAEFLMSRHLGRQLGGVFEAMPAETQRILGQFGIDARHWEALRAVPDHAAIGDRNFLTPDAALRTALPPAEREDLAMRLHAYFNDRASRAMITPGVEERAMLLQGTRPGTPEGELLRFLTQFKMWPTAMINQGLGREVYGKGSKSAAIAGILHMAVAGTVFGYLRMVASDMSKGRNPRDPRDPATWAAALMQGGGLGILGDYLFGEYGRNGQSITESALGPVLGTAASTVFDLWNRIKENAAPDGKKHQDIAPELFKTVLDNTPFVNLFYTRLALNYMFLWQIQEALNPGYLRRYERRVRQQNGQGFWLSPSQSAAGAGVYAVHAPQFGG